MIMEGKVTYNCLSNQMNDKQNLNNNQILFHQSDNMTEILEILIG